MHLLREILTMVVRPLGLEVELTKPETTGEKVIRSYELHLWRVRRQNFFRALTGRDPEPLPIRPTIWEVRVAPDEQPKPALRVVDN